MPERPFVPPTRKPVSEFPTPDPSVAFYTELVNRDDPAYIANAPVSRGALYATMVGAKREVISTYPQLFFLRERKFQMDDQKVLWDWATDENAHDTYNAEVNYVANAVNYPAFTRTYTIRRELYESDPTSVIGSPLPGIISVEITSPGQNHTEARGVIDGTSVAITFTVDPTGGLINGVITNTGEQIIRDRTPITIIGDGQDSSAIARSQPVGCVLTSQKKEELPEDDPLSHELVKVTRIYETLPGPWIYSTRIDKDGAIVKTQTRRQVKDFIVDQDIILNGEWSQTWHKGTDDFVAEETIEARPLPGNPIVTTRVEEDGMVTTITKTLVDATTVVSGETLVAGIWTQTKKEELASTSFVKDTSATNKVVWQVSEARPIPGNPVSSAKVDEDGFEIDIVRTLKDTTLITINETVVAGVWTRTEKQAVTDLVAQEIVTARLVPGAAIEFARVDGDHEVAGGNRRLKETIDIAPSATEGGGFINTVEKREFTDLVSWEIVTGKAFLDEAFYSISIENLIPREFMATIPTFVESHVLAGTASMPVLGLGEFEHSQKQLTKLLYEDRITSLGSITLPVIHTNQELTEEYGGGVLNVTLKLIVSGSEPIDEGYLVARSTLKQLGNGMDIKETAILDGTEWPGLLSSLWDDNMREQYLEFQQVVPVGTPPDVNPGYFAFISEIRKLDKWRSIKINTGKDAPQYVNEGSALITYQFKAYRFPGWLANDGFGYYVRSSNAVLCQHKIKTWWESSVSTPTVTFDEIITGDVVINNLANTGLEYARDVLHDGFSFGVLFFPPTTPTATEYAYGTQSGTTLLNLIGIYNPGLNYAIGNVLTISGDGGNANLTVTSTGVSGSITGYTPISGSFGWAAGSFGPYAATGGSGTDAQFYVDGINVPNYIPGSAWIGSERVIAASVTPEKEPNLWKIQTETVVMR